MTPRPVRNAEISVPFPPSNILRIVRILRIVDGILCINYVVRVKEWKPSKLNTHPLIQQVLAWHCHTIR